MQHPLYPLNVTFTRKPGLAFDLFFNSLPQKMIIVTVHSTGTLGPKHCIAILQLGKASYLFFFNHPQKKKTPEAKTVMKGSQNAF